VGRFEREFAGFCDARHAVAASNGTTALHLGLRALGIGPGDEVLVPDLTFIATANAVTYCGAVPVLVDVDPATWTIDPEAAARRVTPRTRAVVPVHLYGHPADMDPLLALAARHRLAVLEDAAEAFGARYKGRRVGTLGHAATFSFYGNKVLTTGEGGMLVTNHAELARRAAYLRDHAMDPGRRYHHTEIGFNYRMTNIQAAIGCAQLEEIDLILDRRKSLAALYDEELAGIPGLRLPPRAPWAEPVCWLYSVLIEPGFGARRDAVAAGLRDHGIDSRPFFVPLHEQPPHRDGGAFPVAERLSRSGLSLPSATGIAPGDVGRVACVLRARAASR
jgi:perosamine synthetase